ncbi:MAG: phenylacetate--CoA ligase family protein, partial [Oscillospiraceae bacterium]|nr:phenylacetate--CoA ligase family protein [Oscillospiraceae bacterium]
MDFVKPIMKTFVYPMMRLRRGNRTLQYLKELKDSEKAPPSQLAGLQRDLLEKLLDTCVNRTSAYRLPEGTDDGSLPKRWKSIAPLSREVFRAHPEKYLARGVKREHLIPASSGGSTDAPLKFVLDKYTVEHYEAARWRGLSWWGITPTDRSVMLWSSPVELDAAAGKYHRRREKWLKNRVVIPARALNEASLPLHIKFLNRYRPVYFYGFPSALYLFATLMEAAGAQLSFQPKVVVSTAEMLFDFQRETISRVLGCPVANEYCTKEAGLLAFECPRGGLHISCENVLLEALDPLAFKPMPLGEQGVLAATDLNNLSMPRPRFLVGDIISLSSAACPCGRALPLLGSIEGRLGDMLVARDGSFVHGGEMVRLS